VYSNSLIWRSHYNANEQVQVKLDKDYTATTSNAATSSSAGESKEKLAALREKRRLREAGTTAASNAAANPAVPAGGTSLKSDSLKSTGEEESGVEIDSLSQKDNQNDTKESGKKIMMMCPIKGCVYSNYLRIHHIQIVQASQRRRLSLPDMYRSCLPQ
jgi:hypothetical protein